MRNDIYAHLQRLHLGFHGSWQSGQLLSRATTDLSAIRRFAGFGTIFFITNVVTFVVVIALLIDLNWWLGGITALCFLAVAAACFRFERRYPVLPRRAQDQQGDLATYVEDAAAGIRVLKSLGRRDEAAGRHTTEASRVYRTQLDMARLRGTFWAGLDLIPNIMIGLVLLLGTLATSGHELSLGGLVAFITLTLQLVWPIEAMGYILASGQEAATAAQRIYEIFDVEPAIADPQRQRRAAPSGLRSAGSLRPERRGKTVPQGAPESQGQQGRLRFDHVTFTYPGAPLPVLRDVTLELEPGETLALVGANGAGTTTLLQLVPRL